MNTFNTFNLPHFILQSLERLNITTPTPIQALAIPPAMEGKDILGTAQTGTGKTIAYLLPLITQLTKSGCGKALVLAPTRELAIQVKDALVNLLGHKSSLNYALLIGGDPIGKQFIQLKRPVKLVIGTPGRVMDHLERRTLHLDDVQALVLDETDRMLDLGFSEQLDEIRKHLPDSRQTLMFSATMPNNIIRLANKYLKDPQRLSVGSTTQAVPQIKQDIIHTAEENKLSHLLQELEKREGSVIVFVKTKRGADKLAYKLREQNHTVESIHGDLQQRKRERVMRDFRNCKHRIMVATDVAARGLDVPHIRHVVNYDLPQCPEDYIHRIGRTGRAGAEGEAISLISPSEAHLWKLICRLMTKGEGDGNGESRERENLSFRAQRKRLRPFQSKGAYFKKKTDKPFPSREKKGFPGSFKRKAKIAQV